MTVDLTCYFVVILPPEMDSCIGSPRKLESPLGVVERRSAPSRKFNVPCNNSRDVRCLFRKVYAR